MSKIQFAVKTLSIFMSLVAASCGNADVHKDVHVHAGTHAGTYQKPGAPLRVSATEHETVDVGETAEVNITISSHKAGVADVSVSADDALAHDLPDTFTIDFSDGPVELPVKLSASTEGRYYLHLSINMDGRSRNVSYGQSFGDEKVIAEKTQLKVSQPASGGIKRYKAEETITQK